MCGVPQGIEKSWPVAIFWECVVSLRELIPEGCHTFYQNGHGFQTPRGNSFLRDAIRSIKMATVFRHPEGTHSWGMPYVLSKWLRFSDTLREFHMKIVAIFWKAWCSPRHRKIVAISGKCVVSPRNQIPHGI
jgi:hypothetical protein